MSSHASAEHLSHGIDRAAFDVYDQAERHLVAPIQEEGQKLHLSTSGSDSNQSEPTTRPGGIANVRRFSNRVRSKAKATTNKLLHTSPKHTVPQEPSSAPALAPAPSVSADNDRLFRPLPEYKGPQAKDLLHHPIDTFQSLLHGASGAKVAEIMDNQVIAHGADVGLVRVYDKMESADNEEDRLSAREDLEGLQKARQDAYVRWTMDRHVLKVRRIPPHTIPRLQKKNFIQVNDQGDNQMQWMMYGQHLIRFYAEHHLDLYIGDSSSLPAATEEAIIVSVERLLMTSTPYQNILMKIRHISRWDDPMKTAAYLGAYIFFWVIGHLAGAAVLGIILVVVKRRFYPPTPEDLRENIKRSEDPTQTALNLTQLIEQHGSRGWVDALIMDLGPASMLELKDIADTLEIMRNFVEWRNPSRTAFSITLLAFVWLYVTVTPLWLFVKMIQFSAGFMFFGLFPIATRYPQYRILVSPFTWLFWKVPTDAEWAIARLQAEARRTSVAMQERNNGLCEDPADEEGSNSQSRSKKQDSPITVGRYHGTSENHHGDLHVSSGGVSFVTAVRSNCLWGFQYGEVKTVQKLSSGDGLLFVLMDDTAFKVQGLKLRNEVFTQIIGYSGLSWQVTG